MTPEQRAAWCLERMPDTRDNDEYFINADARERIVQSINEAVAEARREAVRGSPEMEQEARQELIRMLYMLKKYSTETPSSFISPKGLALFDALLKFLSLHPQERAFIRALAEDGTDDTTIGAFADWLADYRTDAEARKVRYLRPQPGDIQVLWVNTFEEQHRLHAQLEQHLTTPGGEREVLILRGSQDMRTLSVEQMRQAGWVRLEEVKGD